MLAEGARARFNIHPGVALVGTFLPPNTFIFHLSGSIGWLLSPALALLPQLGQTTHVQGDEQIDRGC